jgi:hypothetical protein
VRGALLCDCRKHARSDAVFVCLFVCVLCSFTGATVSVEAMPASLPPPHCCSDESPRADHAGNASASGWGAGATTTAVSLSSPAGAGSSTDVAATTRLSEGKMCTCRLAKELEIETLSDLEPGCTTDGTRKPCVRHSRVSIYVARGMPTGVARTRCVTPTGSRYT